MGLNASIHFNAGRSVKQMSESRPEKRKVEFIESYWTGGEYGSDYIWNDNHGELIRCKDCANKECFGRDGKIVCDLDGFLHEPDWYCADGERREYVKPPTESATDWNGVECE